MNYLKKRNWLILIISIMFLLLGIRYLFVLITEKNLPVFQNHTHFVLDFEYFYEMGKTAFSSPHTLYQDPQKKGVPILSLNKQVFHPYPPPASLLFRIFSLLPFAVAYLIWSLLIYVIIITACILFHRCIKKEIYNTDKTIHFPILLCVCSAPAFLDSSFANVNSLILLLCIVYISLFIRRKFWLAGIVLSIAFWIKLYPAILLSTLFLTKDKAKLLYGYLSGILGIVILTLTIIPVNVFKEFFFEIMPGFSLQVITHTFNQSFIAFATRLISKPDMYFAYYYITTPNWIRALSFFLFTVGLACVLTVRIKKLSTPITLISAFLCALIPLITPIGWGYTFVLTFPALLILYAMGAFNTRFSTIVYLLCWFAFATPSFHRIEDFGIPWQFRILYYSRYTLSTLVIAGWLAIKMLRTQWSSAGNSDGSFSKERDKQAGYKKEFNI